MIERLQNDLRAALKGGDTDTVRVLRMVLAEAQNRRIELGRSLDEGEVLEVLRKSVRMREDAAEQFDKGNRPERAAEERHEIEILQEYLPRQLEGDELEAAVDEVIEELGASGPGEMGPVMKELMSRYRGRIDGAAASALVRQRLTSS